MLVVSLQHLWVWDANYERVSILLNPLRKKGKNSHFRENENPAFLKRLGSSRIKILHVQLFDDVALIVCHANIGIDHQPCKLFAINEDNA
jgi:hypothetical protein